MPQDYSHILQTTTNGVLDEPSPRAKVEDLVNRAVASKSPIVIHAHGGLVNKQGAYGIVNDLQTHYLKAGIFPVFIVWRTGLFDALQNVDEVVNKPLFKKLQKQLLSFLVGKFGDNGTKSKGQSGITPPDGAQIEKELEKQGKGEVPYDWVKPQPAEEGLSDEEMETLTGSVEFDDELLNEWDREVKLGIEKRGNEDSVRLNEAIVREAEITPADGSKSIFAMALVAKHVVTITARVIWRFYKQRDHGLHATVVEEILRTLYIDSIGTRVWQFMKDDSSDTFAKIGTSPERGGWLLLRLLGDALLNLKNTGKPQPPVSIVGHSAGTIYACHLLEHLRAEQARSGSAWNTLSHPVDKLIFLAPAVTHQIFAKTLRDHGNTRPFKKFRMFTLTDKDERGYYEIPVLYPGSLLYIISGLLENKHDRGTADMPLVGMQRFGQRPDWFNDNDVKEVWAFLQKDGNQTVWSGENRGPGLNCDTLKHGAFDEGTVTDSAGQKVDKLTMQSVIHFITEN